jgi:hypothetical protein
MAGTNKQRKTPVASHIVGFMGDAAQIHQGAQVSSKLWACSRSGNLNAMALFMPYPYTYVPNGSTFGLLHTRTISSIVSLSASTLVPRLCTARKSIMAAGFSAGAREFLSIRLGRASVS